MSGFRLTMRVKYNIHGKKEEKLSLCPDIFLTSNQVKTPFCSVSENHQLGVGPETVQIIQAKWKRTLRKKRKT